VEEGDETVWVAGSGFRIVEEDVEGLRGREEGGQDKYTALPVRRGKRVESVLATSPGQITSPVFQSRLFFV
jgi:hypothetical protein